MVTGFVERPEGEVSNLSPEALHLVAANPWFEEETQPTGIEAQQGCLGATPGPQCVGKENWSCGLLGVCFGGTQCTLAGF